MLKSNAFPANKQLRIFTKNTILRGQPATVDCVEICGQTYALTKGAVNLVSLEDDWFEDVADPEAVVNALKEHASFKADIFTFWQRLPDVEPKYRFYMEWEEIAVLPVKSHDHWWNHQIKSSLRNKIRKAKKEGLLVKEAAYDDNFVLGMTTIFNEASVRQGRQFWHYGKDFETVKSQFSRFIHREDIIGAYHNNELIGFIMIGNAGRYASIGQIISTIKHRDKKTNNALIAGAVELCEKRKLPYLVYHYWSADSLSDFKRLCGFEKTRVPRYFVPLTLKGKLALKLGFHHGWKSLIPGQIKASLKKVRSRWYRLGTSE